MKTQSAKAKGRNLQKWVVSTVLRLFPVLTPRDVRSTSMGASGTDILLSQTASTLVPLAIECKNQEKLKQVYDMYDQATTGEGEPVIVMKMNRRTPLAVVDAEYFFNLVKECQNFQFARNAKT